MKVSIHLDINTRKAIDKIRSLWVAEKAIYRSERSTANERKDAHTKRKTMTKTHGTPNKVVNYCVRTGESRSIITKFGRNRHLVRDIARRGKLPGVVKASW